jgi:hypothetical protein
MECMSDGCRERRGCFERLAMPCNAAGHPSVMMRKYVGDLLGRVCSLEPPVTVKCPSDAGRYNCCGTLGKAQPGPWLPRSFSAGVSELVSGWPQHHAEKKGRGDTLFLWLLPTLSCFETVEQLMAAVRESSWWSSFRDNTIPPSKISKTAHTFSPPGTRIRVAPPLRRFSLA